MKLQVYTDEMSFVMDALCFATWHYA